MKIKTFTTICLSFFLACSSVVPQQVLAQEYESKAREGLPGRRISAGTRGGNNSKSKSAREGLPGRRISAGTRGGNNDKSKSKARQGLPGRRLGGGTRGECDLQGKNLIALVPENNLGVTQAAKPNFFFYLPASSQSKSIEFILQDDKFNVIYEKTFTVTKAKGIVKVDLSDDPFLPDLSVGNNYRWFFSIICNPQRRENDISVEGWVRREKLENKTTQLIKVAPPLERVNLYAEQGFSQDAIITLANLMITQPQNSQISAHWSKLLAGMKLDSAIAQEPFLDLKRPENSSSY